MQYPPSAELDLGPVEAAVEMVIYVDLDCDLCLEFLETVELVREAHPSDLHVVLRLFPLLQANDKSAQAAAAVLGTPSQPAAWQVIDLLRLSRTEWADLPVDEFKGWLLAQSDDLGLDRVDWNESISSPSTIELVQLSAEHGLTSIPGVPFAFINGQPLLLGLDQQTLEGAVRLAILSANLPGPPPESEPLPAAAVLHTNIGEIEIELLPELAPRAVASFVHLVNHDWYDGSGFYRVVPGEWIEGGDPTGSGLGGPGYVFDLELAPNLAFATPGGIGLLNDGPGTNGSRFFVALAARPDLASVATQFGRVRAGVELLDTLPARDPERDLLTPFPLVIEQVELIDE